MEISFHDIRQHVIGIRNASKSQVLNFVTANGLAVPRRARGGPDFDIADAVLAAMFSFWAGDKSR